MLVTVVVGGTAAAVGGRIVRREPVPAPVAAVEGTVLEPGGV